MESGGSSWVLGGKHQKMRLERFARKACKVLERPPKLLEHYKGHFDGCLEDGLG